MVTPPPALVLGGSFLPRYLTRCRACFQHAVALTGVNKPYLSSFDNHPSTE